MSFPPAAFLSRAAEGRRWGSGQARTARVSSVTCFPTPSMNLTSALLLFPSLPTTSFDPGCRQNGPPPFTEAAASPGAIQLLERSVGKDIDGRVHYDSDDEGDLWARGRHWKMRFDGRQAVYYPLLGPRQTEHHPVTLSPIHVSVGGWSIPFLSRAEPRRNGDAITIDRSSFVETYELEPESLEQLFVFPEIPMGGDLVLRIRTDSDLERAEDDAGLELRSDLGGMRYSRAVAIDAAGERESATTRFLGDIIEIRVDAAFLARARAPLVIDPVVSRFSVDSSAYTERLPDVAYDASTDRWLVVYERVDGGDVDVAYRLVSDSGSVFASGYINLDSANWNRPKCANHNTFDTFYTVANVVKSGGWLIRGRVMSAWEGLPGNTYTVSDGGPGEYCINPDIGGDSSANWYGTYCVVFERLKSSGDSDVNFRMVVGTGAPVGTYSYGLAGSIYPEVMPSISKSNDARQWAVAFDRNDGSLDRVHAGRINWDGNIAGYPYSVLNTTGDNAGPQVSSLLNGSTRFLVASASNVENQADVLLVAMDGYTKLTEVNLGALEYGGPLNYATQNFPALECDSNRFFVAYNESVNGQHNIFGSALRLSGGTLTVVENRAPVQATVEREFHPAIASKEGSGGPNRRMLITYNYAWAPDYNWQVWAAFYSLP